MVWQLWSRNRQGEPQGVFSHATALSLHELSDVMPAKLHMSDSLDVCPAPQHGDLDRTKVEELASALQREDTRLEASEPLRGLGNLAGMLSAATNAKRSPETGDPSLQVSMVAGAGFGPATFGL